MAFSCSANATVPSRLRAHNGAGIKVEARWSESIKAWGRAVNANTDPRGDADDDNTRSRANDVNGSIVLNPVLGSMCDKNARLVGLSPLRLSTPR